MVISTESRQNVSKRESIVLCRGHTLQDVCEYSYTYDGLWKPTPHAYYHVPRQFLTKCIKSITRDG